MLKKILIGLGSVLVAGFLLYINDLGGLSKIKAWMDAPSVEIRSVMRPFAKQVYAGEKLRFSLQNIACEKVFWILDESTIEQGGIEIEYFFKYDKNKPIGIETHHRVDAFYRQGNKYFATSTLVPVVNLNAHARIDKILEELKINMQALEDYQLKNVSLATFSNGKFYKNKSFEVMSSDLKYVDNKASNVTLSWKPVDSIIKSMYAQAEHSRPEDSWTELTFLDKVSQQEIVLIQAINEIIKDSSNNQMD